MVLCCRKHACCCCGAAGGSVLGGNAAYNAKMDEHMREQQQQLEQAQAALSTAQQAEGMIRYAARAPMCGLPSMNSAPRHLATYNTGSSTQHHLPQVPPPTPHTISPTYNAKSAHTLASTCTKQNARVSHTPCVYTHCDICAGLRRRPWPTS
jgi:transcription initiation factor TFIID subunit TAF12